MAALDEASCRGDTCRSPGSAIDIAMKLQGFQQRVEVLLLSPIRFADVGDLKLGGLLVEQVEDLQLARSTD